MPEKIGRCLICRGALDQPARGRPRRYCSTACRRSGELEIARTNVYLRRLEEALQNSRLDAFGADVDPGFAGRVEAESARLRGRLLDLLDGP